jgi:hypothetical protein
MLHPGSLASVTPSLVAGVASATPDPDQDANYTDAGAGRLGRVPLFQEVVMPHMRRTPKTLHIQGLPTIHPNAAGMDIGADEIVVAVPPDRDPEPVRVFRTFTPDLAALVAWLLACGIDTVALESTGVYWVPIYELLEQHNIVPYLVNARHVKTVPGRRAIGMMPSGCKSSTRSGCWRPRFARTRRLPHCERWCAIGPNSSSIGRRISCTCRRRCSR